MLALLWPVFLFLAVVLAQRDLDDQIPECAQGCITAVAQAQNCVLLTAQCLCPGQGTIVSCINQACSSSISDLSTSLSMISEFCSPITPGTSPSSSSKPPPPSIITSTTTSTTLVTGSPSQTPHPTPSSATSLTQSPLPLTQLSLVSSTTAATTSSSNIIPTPATTLTLPPTSLTSQTQPTVVVFSTQFAPPASNSNSGGARGRSAVDAFTITVAIAGVVGFLVF